MLTLMNDSVKRKRGRPKGSTSENTANQTLPRVRVTEDQLKSYKQASKREKKNFSAWVREKLDKASKEVYDSK